MNIHMAIHRVNTIGRFIGRCWYWVTFFWVLVRAIFFWWLFLVLIWDFTDLLGIPLIQDLKAGIQQAASAPAKLFEEGGPGRDSGPNRTGREKKDQGMGPCPLPAYP